MGKVVFFYSKWERFFWLRKMKKEFKRKFSVMEKWIKEEGDFKLYYAVVYIR